MERLFRLMKKLAPYFLFSRQIFHFPSSLFLADWLALFHSFSSWKHCLSLSNSGRPWQQSMILFLNIGIGRRRDKNMLFTIQLFFVLHVIIIHLPSSSSIYSRKSAPFPPPLLPAEKPPLFQSSNKRRRGDPFFSSSLDINEKDLLLLFFFCKHNWQKRSPLSKN